MAFRSKPVAIETLTNPVTGRVTYRVTGTLRPGAKQSKLVTSDWDEALNQQTEWEEQRIRGASLSRPKITHLVLQQLREAEAIVELLKGEGLTPMEAVKLGLKAYHEKQNAPTQDPMENTTYESGFTCFYEETEEHVSEAQKASYRQRGERFGAFIGKDTPIRAITEQHMKNWLEKVKVENGGVISKKTWNNLFGDVAAVFNFFVRKGWLKKSPFSGMKRFSKKALRRGPKKRLTIEQAQKLMAWARGGCRDCPFYCGWSSGRRRGR